MHIDVLDLTCAVRFDVPVLISGGDGERRAWVAHLIHKRSRRRNRPFIAVPALHADDRIWRCASEGTLFVEDLGALDPLGQGDLQRRLDARDHTDSSTRLIVGTGDNMLDRLSAKCFSAELFYRLNTVHLVIEESSNHLMLEESSRFESTRVM